MLWTRLTLAALLVTVPALPAREPGEFAAQQVVSAADQSIPVTNVYDGMPPKRYQRDRASSVSFGTVGECGTPPIGYQFEACVRDQRVHMPNPCNYPHEEFARLMCHENAHLFGWPSSHGP